MPSSISTILQRIAGRGYKAYKDLAGATERVHGVTIRVVRVQGDPFAPPSVVEVRTRVGSPPFGISECRGAETAVEDLALRALRTRLERASRKMGEGHSGVLRVPRPGPVMVPRSASLVDGVELRFLVRVGLPSRGRRVLAREAYELLLERLPRAVLDSVGWLRGKGREQLEGWCRLWHTQERIRAWMAGEGLVAFVADGSILPRRCGGCWEPLEGAVPFRSPSSLRVEVETPYHGVVSGMGVREGLTVIAGPAFHGKTTLLEAISLGVWNHIPGDGRELVLTRRDAVLVESENGRNVTCVDLRAFLRSLPGGGSVECFTTEDASGATSAAASIQEAVEHGSRLILLDEDNVATNLLHRDVWVERVTGKKTLVTLTELAASMKRNGISLIVVASGALPLLAAADTIIVMDEYRPVDVSGYRVEARERAREAGLLHEEDYTPPRPRRVAPPRVEKWKLRGAVLQLGGRSVLLSQGNVKQLEDPYMLETVVEAALRGARVSDTVRSSRVPERSMAREIDALLVLDRLPGLRARPS